MTTTEKTPGERGGRAPQVDVQVTPEIIARSCRQNSAHCMIAEAISEQVDGATFISVDLQTIRWTNRKKALRYTYLTPRVAQMGIVLFDQGEPVAPFSFRLRGGAVTKSNPRGRQARAHTIEDGQISTVRARVGGKTPPGGKLLHGTGGKVRAFGLRALHF